jgi:hypothetical protein
MSASDLFLVGGVMAILFGFWMPGLAALALAVFLWKVMR